MVGIDEHIDPERRLKVLSIAAWCPWHELEDSRRIGEAVREAFDKIFVRKERYYENAIRAIGEAAL